MNNLKEILIQFGLNEKEASIYIASLDLGSATALAIAKRAGVQRTHFYDLSQKLMAIGLITQSTKGKKRLFAAADPDQLLKIQERRLERLKKLLPEFKAIYNTSGQKPKVFYYDGPDGVDYINEDTLKYGGEIVGFTTPRFVAGQSKSTGNEFIRKRISTGINARIIGEATPEIQKLKERDEKELRETRILSSDIFSSEVEIMVYGNRVSIIDYKEKWGFIIEGSEIAKVMKMIFEIIWSKWER